ncbi:LysR family transcriptional regulator [Spongiibacter taiwanensis]|uniref:LysR family transcriptional regulator n=1 Tax=Spongiibacter taiwanensis TaxID=1748242 RepID=UPI0020356935|nr:LysR family transcriptional regulator [Spongiibacter taiwanensis]USA44679.1 LysR family transcriptional regulator [Spongiibacter taiwanensis]
MNLSRIDLNLLVYLDVLLREKNVTRASEQLGITQPALSNGLRRLRDLFDDPLLVRTSEGMTPTERALELQPQVRNILASVEQAVLPVSAFEVSESARVFRIMASDYAESTLLTQLLFKLRDEAPNITLDILTPSDVTFQDLEQGKIDMALNRFDRLPQSFHQATVWRDNFSCLMSADNPAARHFDMDAFLAAPHIWVSKTGMGVGRGMSQRDSQRLGWVDEALAEFGHERQIRVFTRHYQVAALLARHRDLIATLPSQMARLYEDDTHLVIRKPPFMIIPIELKLAWSPLLQHDPGHIWLRRRIVDLGQEIIAQGQV